MNTGPRLAHERFEDRLLDTFLERFEDVRGDFGVPEGTLPGRGSQRRPVMLGALVVLAAAGLGVPLGLNIASSPTRTVTTLHLASYSLKLPAGYHRASSGTANCLQGVVFVYMGPAGSAAPAYPTQASEPAVTAAVDSAGGCVSVALSVPYVPGTAMSPSPIGWSWPPGEDQVQMVPQGAQGLHLDGDQGWVGTRAFAGQYQVVVDLTVPSAGSKVQSLVVEATGVSQSQLVSIVSAGLSLPSPGTSSSLTSTP